MLPRLKCQYLLFCRFCSLSVLSIRILEQGLAIGRVDLQVVFEFFRQILLPFVALIGGRIQHLAQVIMQLPRRLGEPLLDNSVFNWLCLHLKRVFERSDLRLQFLVLCLPGLFLLGQQDRVRHRCDVRQKSRFVRVCFCISLRRQPVILVQCALESGP